ncbi:hypothetical protein AC579_9914 [Pseudocercospora musae]|uniref:Uncharacterized protein n=1 Tax=Pseudocercospora musae TaxID=113226 RepID=A0A139IFG3_9PEZI|nr:hypothetical protein AC579_9914 [Pseudocercospora musae]
MVNTKDQANPPIYRSIIIDLYIFHDNHLQLFKMYEVVGTNAARLTFADVQFVDFSQEDPLITGERIFRYSAYEHAIGNETVYGQLDLAILLSLRMKADQKSLTPIQIGNREEESPEYLPALTVGQSDMTGKLQGLASYLGDNVEYPILNKILTRYRAYEKAFVAQQMGNDKLGLARLATNSLTAALWAKQQEPLVLPKPIYGLIAYYSDTWEAGLFFLLMHPFSGDFVDFAVIGDFSDRELQLYRAILAVEPEVMDRKYMFLTEDDKAPKFTTMLSGTRNGRSRMRYLEANDTTVFGSRTRTALKVKFKEDWEEWLNSPPSDNSPPKWFQMQQEDCIVLSKNNRRQELDNKWSKTPLEWQEETPLKYTPTLNTHYHKEPAFQAPTLSPHEDLAVRKLEYEATTFPAAQEIPAKAMGSVNWQSLTLGQYGLSAATSEVCDAAPDQLSILLCSGKSILEAVDIVKHPIKGRSVKKLTFAIEEGCLRRDGAFLQPGNFEEYKDACYLHGVAAPTRNDSRPFEVLLKAMAISKIQVKSLAVARSLEDGAWAMPIHVVVMQDDFAFQFKNMLQHTEELDLSVWVENVADEVQWEDYTTVAKSSIARFVEVLAEAPKLKSLTLHLAFDQYNPDLPARNQILPAILLNTKSSDYSSLPAGMLEKILTSLETLSISLANVDVQKLLAFVSR